MSAYTTNALVRAATGMTDNTKITDTTVDAKIAFAQGTIDSYLGDVYTLPLASVPSMISFIALEMASAMLYIDEYGEETQNLDKGWKKKLDQCFSMLEEIQARTLKLRDTDGTELADSDHFMPVGYPNDLSSDPSACQSTAPEITMDFLP